MSTSAVGTVEHPADLVRGAQRPGARPVPRDRGASSRSGWRRVATLALAVVGALLGFASGIVLIFATGLVAFC